MISNSRDYLFPIAILLGITVSNLGIMAGLIFNLIPSSITAQLVILAAIETALLLLTYRYIKRKLMDASL